MTDVTVIQCDGPGGHFYNGDKYSKCPHCGSGPKTGTQTKQPEIKRQKTENGENSQKSGGILRLGKKNKTKDIPTEQDDDKTYALSGDAAKKEPASPLLQPAAHTGQPEGSKENDFPAESPEPPRSQKPQEIPEPQKIPVLESMPQHSKPRQQSLQNDDSSISSQVNKVRATADSSKTIGIYSSADSSPTVGWIVALNGEYMGESFELNEGNNSIGRSSGNAVSFAKENSISRERHASVMFEPKRRNFFISPGESSGLTYLNDEVVMAPQQLNAHDKIRLGEVLLLFLPLCGEHFGWDDLIK